MRTKKDQSYLRKLRVQDKRQLGWHGRWSMLGAMLVQPIDVYFAIRTEVRA